MEGYEIASIMTWGIAAGDRDGTTLHEYVRDFSGSGVVPALRMDRHRRAPHPGEIQLHEVGSPVSSARQGPQQRGSRSSTPAVARHTSASDPGLADQGWENTVRGSRTTIRSPWPHQT